MNEIQENSNNLGNNLEPGDKAMQIVHKEDGTILKATYTSGKHIIQQERTITAPVAQKKEYQDDIKRMYFKEKKSVREIADTFGMSIGYVYKLLRNN